MDVAGVVSYIANMGFPAVLCIVMIWLNHEQAKQHKEELSALQDAIKNNTEAINELKILLYSEKKSA